MLICYNRTAAAVTLAVITPAKVIPAAVGGFARGVGVDVTSELRGLTGGNYVSLQAQVGAGTLYYAWSGDPEYAVTGLTVTGPVASLHAATHVTGQPDAVTVNAATTTPASYATTATCTAEIGVGHYYLPAPMAADLIYIVADVALTHGGPTTLALAHQPDYARKLQIRITDATNTCTGTATIIGVDAKGLAATQAIPITGGTRTVITTKAYSTVTSIITTIVAGEGAGINIGVGQGDAFGMPLGQTATLVVVFKETLDTADEAVGGGTLDAVNGTFIPVTVANATHNYKFLYTFTKTVAQAAHTHTVTAHGHVMTVS